MLPPLSSSPAPAVRSFSGNSSKLGEPSVPNARHHLSETLLNSVIIIILRVQVCLALYGPGGGRGHLQRNLVQQGEQGADRQFRESKVVIINHRWSQALAYPQTPQNNDHAELQQGG